VEQVYRDDFQEPATALAAFSVWAIRLPGFAASGCHRHRPS
jgi:hypothetical protein